MKALLLVAIALLVWLGAACGGGSVEPVPVQPTSTTSPASTAATGPAVAVEPRGGPAGTSVTVSGSGWPSGVALTIGGPGSGRPYASVTVAENGTFRATFILERQPDGGALMVGRFDLVARTEAAEVRVPFQVQSPRPVSNPREGG